MATSDAIEEARSALDDALSYQDKNLISRANWGSITFESAESDLDRAFSILGYLKVLPLEILTDQAITQIASETKQLIAEFQKVDSFSIEQNNPPEVRDAIVASVHKRVDQFYTVTTPWIPFLAYQKGDVARNIEELTKAARSANDVLETAKNAVNEKTEEIDGLISQAREASAAAGVAVFTQDFKNEAEQLESRAKTWLRATGLFAAGTVAVALAFQFIPAPAGDIGAWAQHFGAKVAAIVALFTATVWCGRVYKAVSHLVVLNKHRANALQTFQAFSRAASDDTTKDAVLLEATHSIFSPGSSGFLDGKSSSREQEIRLIDIGRGAGGRRQQSGDDD